MNNTVKYSVAGAFALAVGASVFFQQDIGDAFLTDEVHAMQVIANDTRFDDAQIRFTGYEPLGCLRGEHMSTGFVAAFDNGRQIPAVVCKAPLSSTANIRLK